MKISEIEMKKLADEYVEYRDLMNEAKKRMDELTGLIREGLAGDTKVVIGNRKISDVVAHRSSFDKEKFVDDFGEDAYKEYTKISEYGYIKVA